MCNLRLRIQIFLIFFFLSISPFHCNTPKCVCKYRDGKPSQCSPFNHVATAGEMKQFHKKPEQNTNWHKFGWMFWKLLSSILRSKSNYANNKSSDCFYCSFMGLLCEWKDKKQQNNIFDTHFWQCAPLDFLLNSSNSRSVWSRWPLEHNQHPVCTSV